MTVGLVVEPAVGVHHDASDLAAVAGEPVLQDVGRSLRFDPGDAGAVVELAAGRSRGDDDEDGADDPEHEDPEGVPGAAVAEAVEKCAHWILLGVRPRLRVEATIEERADAVLRCR